MLRKLIKYTDYNGVERTEEFYFNLSRSQVIELELTTEGGLEYSIKKMIQTTDRAGLILLFKDLIMKAYGEKSADGKRFEKSEELSRRFSQTEAYEELYMELLNDAKMAAAFVNGIVPNESKLTEEQLAAKLANEKAIDSLSKFSDSVVPKE